MDMRLILTLILLSLLIQCQADMPSTTPDGCLQAIAQGPDSMCVYWRHEGRSTPLYVDGKVAGELAPDPNRPFACRCLTSLAPNTSYTFALGQSSPSVTERTWSMVPAQAGFDVLVIGGTASGVAAAVTAAKMGLKVALVESTNRLGGMSSNGLGAADIRDPARANGFFQDFRERVTAVYGGNGRPKFEPRIANAIIKAMVYEQPSISVLLRTDAVGAIRAGDRVCGAEVRDNALGRRGRLLAKVTIDATDCADFAAACGAEYRIGREPRTESEPHAGFIYFDDAEQAILPGSTGEGDARMQSYAYLMTWKDYGDKPAPLIEKPKGYDPKDYQYSPPWDQTWAAKHAALPNGKFEINQHPFGTDKPGVNYDYPCARESRRREVEAIYRDRALGYLYFMQNERGHANLGLADDEFLDSGNFPPGLYIREARRVVGEHVLNEGEVTNARKYFRADSIAIADYPMDSHAVEELKAPDNRLDKGEGEIYLSTLTPWSQVPYGVIVPKRVEGLLVTTAVSATHVAYGTLRLEPVRMSMGQAAAAAAYLAILNSIQEHDISLRRVNPAWIQDRILSQHAYIYWNSDVTPATRHFKAINFLGARGVFRDLSGARRNGNPETREEAFRPDANLTHLEALDALHVVVELEGGTAPTGALQESIANQPITRGLFAAWLVQAKMMTDPTWRAAPARQSYTDVPPGSPYFDAVEILRAHRITASLFEEHQPGVFQPDAPITRADAAEAIYLAHRPYAMR